VNQYNFYMSALTLEAHGGHDTPRLPRFDNAYDLVRLCGGKVRFHELVAPLLGVLQQRTLAALNLLAHPSLIVGGNLHQIVFVHGEQASVMTEESHGPRSIQKGRNARVQQDAVETRIVHGNAILVVFVKGVHRYPPNSSSGSLCDERPDDHYQGYQGQSP